jgi:hypothetical protein
MMSKYVIRLETKLSLPLLRNDLFDFHLLSRKAAATGRKLNCGFELLRAT